jgi:hypothetical protein
MIQGIADSGKIFLPAAVATQCLKIIKVRISEQLLAFGVPGPIVEKKCEFRRLEKILLIGHARRLKCSEVKSFTSRDQVCFACCPRAIAAPVFFDNEQRQQRRDAREPEKQPSKDDDPFVRRRHGILAGSATPPLRPGAGDHSAGLVALDQQ